MARFPKLLLAAALSSALSAAQAAEDDVSVDDDAALANIQRSTTTSVSPLSLLYLSTRLDGVTALMQLCGDSSGYLRMNDPRTIVAAMGYDQGAVPYSALEQPAGWCRCVIDVAARANQIAAERLGVDGWTALPNASELDRARLLPNKQGNGSTSCRAGGWRVDFRPDGLQLMNSGVPILGGDQKVVAGRRVDESRSVSQSWVE